MFSLLRSSVAIVFQEPQLTSGTIAENIDVGVARASHEDLVAAARQAEAHEFIMKLPDAYGYQVGVNGACLSSGQGQRLSIARALLRNAPVLILDEATGNLDVATEKRVLRNILQSRRGLATTVIVTHRLHVARLADEILVLRDGYLAECGDHRTLLSTNGIYARMWAASQRENDAPVNECATSS